MTKINKTEYWPVSATTTLTFSLTVVFLSICAFAANRLWQQDVTVTYENNILENIQVFFLTLATTTHLWQLSRQPAGAATARMCHMVLAMLCLSIMVREVDIDKLGPQPAWGITENLIRLAGAAVWIWLIVHIYDKRLTLWRFRADILCTPTSVLTGLGVMCYMASWFFDKSVVPLPAERSQLWEETLQMSATVLLFTAALRAIPLAKN